MSDTKTHILMVSLKLFLQKNFKEVTMKEIVRETGLSKGAFYHYFESKEKLFYEIIDYFFAAILEYDFKQLPNDSLQHFYQANAEQLNTLRFQFLSKEKDDGEDFINLNFFALLFDAFKLFPEFRSQMEAYHREGKESMDRGYKNRQVHGRDSIPPHR